MRPRHAWLLALPLILLTLPVLLLIAAVGASPPTAAPARPFPDRGRCPIATMTPRHRGRCAWRTPTSTPASAPAEFTNDLARVVAGRPDVVTLNETYTRSRDELTPPGYQAWRAESPRDARETPVLWRTDTWRPIAHGTELVHDRPVRWGTRYLNWVTLQATDGTRLSVISAHASPGGPGRDGLLETYIDRLTTVLTSSPQRRPRRRRRRPQHPLPDARLAHHAPHQRPASPAPTTSSGSPRAAGPPATAAAPSTTSSSPAPPRFPTPRATSATPTTGSLPPT